MVDSPKADDVAIELATVLDEMSAVDFFRLKQLESNKLTVKYERKKIDPNLIDSIAGLRTLPIPRKATRSISLEDIERLTDMTYYDARLKMKPPERENIFKSPAKMEEMHKEIEFLRASPEDKVQLSPFEEDHALIEKEEPALCALSPCCPRSLVEDVISYLRSPCKDEKKTENDEELRVNLGQYCQSSSEPQSSNDPEVTKSPLKELDSGTSIRHFIEKIEVTDSDKELSPAENQEIKGPQEKKEKKSKFMKLFRRKKSSLPKQYS